MWGPDQPQSSYTLHTGAWVMPLTCWQMAIYPFAWERNTVAHGAQLPGPERVRLRRKHVALLIMNCF